MRALLFFLSFLSLTDACLVIGYSEPPACACKTIKINPGNLFDNVISGVHSLFLNVVKNNIKEPIVDIDDCSGSVYCEGDYSLFVFDTDKNAAFGAYAADGMCQPFSQTWLVDNEGVLQKYKELRGVCVKNSRCPCGQVEFDHALADSYFKDNTYYNENLRMHPIKSPNMTFADDGCQSTRTCDEGWLPRVYLGRANNEHAFEHIFTGSECMSSGRWYATQRMTGVTAGWFTDVIYPLCVDFSRTI